MKKTDLIVAAAVGIGVFVLVNRARAQAVLGNGVVRAADGRYVAAPQSTAAKQAWVESSVRWILDNAKPYYDPKTGKINPNGNAQSAPIYGPEGDYSPADYGLLMESDYSGFGSAVEADNGFYP